jgi:serine/threonine protein kinase
MFSFGVTLWEIFSGHTPYLTDARPQSQLKASLPYLLKDPHNPLRPDLDLVDPRVRPLLQVSSFALKCFYVLEDGSSFQPQRCWAMDPNGRISAADLFNELQKLPRNASLTAVVQVVEREGAAAGPDSAQAPAPAPAPAPDPKVLFPATALPLPNFIRFAGCCRLSHPHPRQTQHP